MTQKSPPPAQGIRLDWQAMPASVRGKVEQWLGSPIVNVVSQPGGFSPGVAARLRTADNRRVFVKAVGPELNPDTPSFHRQEAKITALIPPTAPVPRLLWSVDDVDATGWVVLVFDDIEGQQPTQPWDSAELGRVLKSLVALTDALTPSPISTEFIPTARQKFAQIFCGWRQLLENRAAHESRLDEWSLRHMAALAEIEANAPAAVEGDTLLHIDIRADNLLLTDEAVWVVDWPHAAVGAAWVDVLLFAPSVAMQGGPLPENVVEQHPAYQQADFDAVTAALVSMAGYFIYRSLRPPPPGLPTLRAFQAAQGAVAREWVARRLGWD